MFRNGIHVIGAAAATAFLSIVYASPSLAQNSSSGVGAAANQVSIYSNAVATTSSQIMMIAKKAGISVPSQVYSVSNHINKTSGKINNAAGVISGVQLKVSNFKEADAVTKIQMRCDSPLKVLKMAAAKIGYNLTSYLKARQKVCELVPYVARAQQMYETYQSIKVNGLPLIQKHKSQKHKFGKVTKRTRTTNLWVDVRYMPDDKKLQYSVTFKFSDNKPIQIIPPPKFANDNNSKKGICIPLTSWASFCFKVLEATASNAKIDLWAKFRQLGQNKTIGFGAVVVPAPFGYLDQLQQMKDKKKQQAITQMKNKLASLAGIDQQTQAKIQKLAGLAVKINQ
jgi:uncharacterized protein YcfJ